MRNKIIMIVLLFVNIGIAYLITSLLGIRDVVLFQSMTLTFNVITYEIIIWFILSLIEACIFEYIAIKNYKYVAEANRSLAKLKQKEIDTIKKDAQR